MTTQIMVALATLTIARADEAKAPELVFKGLGAHTRGVATKSASAQRYFNQGLNFLYAFNHDEAIRAFKATIALDHNCAMAYWGLATANGPHINNTFVAPPSEKAANDAIKKAMSLRNGLPAMDAALIEAASKRFSWPQAKDRRAMDVAYANAMRKVWQRFSTDADVGALFAESMMDLRPWDFWKPDGSPQPGTSEITATIGKVLKLNPNHPMALHLAIHAWEASPTPDRAIAGANNLRNLQPGLGHMVHMPSHIDVRTGQWRASIVANEKAIAADDEYRTRRPKQGFYRIYMAHNRHMLAFSAMMIGQSAKSIKYIDTMVAAVPKDWAKQNAMFIDGMMALPMEARVRFGRWDEILATPEYPAHFPLSTALRHAARGVAFAAKGQVMEAEAEHMLFEQAKVKVPKEFSVGNNSAAKILAIAELVLAGEIQLAKGDMDAALSRLRKAVAAEDQLRYDEPPDWILPTRHIYGVALLKAGRNTEAEAVYRKDLQRLPNNGWALNGLATALSRQGKSGEAAQVQAKFEKAWQGADIEIKSSCLCVPNP